MCDCYADEDEKKMSELMDKVLREKRRPKNVRRLIRRGDLNDRRR